MKKVFYKILILLVLAISAFLLTAQKFNSDEKIPDVNVLSEAHDLVQNLFKELSDGKSEKIANWIVEQIGYNWDVTTKIQQASDFKTKLDIILIDPPESAYGKLDGYDLISESYLPGSDRYFRLTYISYHMGAPLMWEFRFYVKPDGEISLNYISWAETNPFEYLSTNDMLLPLWYKK